MDTKSNVTAAIINGFGLGIGFFLAGVLLGFTRKIL